MAARATPNAGAAVTMRDLEGDLSNLQRVVEFLPIEQLFKEKSHTVKAVSRAWRTAARRALTRGRWKPLRTLEEGGELICSEASNVEPERSAFERDAREAWALYPGEVLLLLLDCNTPVLNQYIDDFYRHACDFLSLVVEPTKQGFASIVAAFEKALQLGRSRTGYGHRRGAILCLLMRWTRQAVPGSFSNDTIYALAARLATPEWLGDELGRWADPASAAKVVDELIVYYYDDWHPRYDDLARAMSVNWADSEKRARFVARFVERQAQEDADIATADAEAPPIVDDGMYNHL